MSCEHDGEQTSSEEKDNFEFNNMYYQTGNKEPFSNIQDNIYIYL